VVVSVPIYYPEMRIKSLLDLRRGWIVKKLKEIEKMGEIRQKREFRSGEVFSILGQTYTLQVIREPGERIWLVGNSLCLSLSPGINPTREASVVQKRLQAWFEERALDKFKERILIYKKALRVEAKNISVKNYKSRWGACKSNGELIFNWRLIMAPEEIIDYVVAHELCHLRVFSHSPKFWKLVSSVYPTHREATQWLRLMDYRGELKF
jgi:predicted metal-dependent hydrolase